MPTTVNPAKLSGDDFSGDWQEDMPDLFRVLNKFSGDASSALSSQVSLVSNLGFQKIDLKSIVVPTDWIVPTLAAGWSNYGGTYESAAYRKDASGTVWVRGLVASAATGAVFTLPSGFVPAQSLTVATVYSDGITDMFGRLDIKGVGTNPPGVVSVFTGTAPTGYASLHCSFQCSSESPAAPSCFPIKVTSKLNSGKAALVLPGEVTDQNKGGGKTPAIGPVSVAWHNEAGFDGTKHVNNIVIDNITGLLPGRTYSMTLYAAPLQ